MLDDDLNGDGDNNDNDDNDSGDQIDETMKSSPGPELTLDPET